MVFQMFALGPHWFQKSLSCEFPDPPEPVSWPRISESPDVDDEDDAGEARLCNFVGTVEVSCDSAVCVLVPADVAVAWLTVAACPSSPAALVVCCGAVNGVTVEAAAEAAA